MIIVIIIIIIILLLISLTSNTCCTADPQGCRDTHLVLRLQTWYYSILFQLLIHAVLQIVDVCIPELEYVRVAQILTIGCEIAEAYKHALATPELRRQFTLETRMSLGAAERFTATDYLQVWLVSRE
jgi:hypothetical protein